MLIQGLAADQIKLASVKLLNKLKGTTAGIIGIIHDEILVEVPGKWWFTDKAFDSEGNLVNYSAIEVNDEVKEYMKIIVDCMEEAQTYTFNKIAPEINVLGKASAKAAPFWLH